MLTYLWIAAVIAMIAVFWVALSKYPVTFSNKAPTTQRPSRVTSARPLKEFTAPKDGYYIINGEEFYLQANQTYNFGIQRRGRKSKSS